eukprot:TRINITY_DN17399_c0_g1_i1.p1 TRINITY_DN17399_c0_g1~~TRINITY_DN17399_c0_g1_i1.p1  ORF type:complete len:148 (-),score=20.33 TRINITY_DN17399_c0_g1_i1:1-423(-)
MASAHPGLATLVTTNPLAPPGEAVRLEVFDTPERPTKERDGEHQDAPQEKVPEPQSPRTRNTASESGDSLSSPSLLGASTLSQALQSSNEDGARRFLDCLHRPALTAYDAEGASHIECLRQNHGAFTDNFVKQVWEMVDV